jgi:hypothetical protein
MVKAMIRLLCSDGNESAGYVPSEDPSRRLSLRILRRSKSTGLESIEPRGRRKITPAKRLPVTYYPPFIIVPRISFIESPA